MVEITRATLNDLPAITAIYNKAVAESVATFVIRQRTAEEQFAWFEAHGEKHPVVVARADGEVVGWASLNVFIARCAYERTVEDSVYVKDGWRGRGVGRRLLSKLVELAGEAGHHSIVARIGDHGAASIALHRSLGFEIVGELREAGRKFDRWVDVTLMQRLLG